jgi:hypothetical protein
VPLADDDLAVSPWTRRFVHLFLLMLAVSGVARLELFPFSAFRLFSEMRPAERQSWQLRAVDEAGDETPIVLGELPVAYRNTSRLLGEFDDLSPAERDEICDAWAQPYRDDGAEIARVRVYEVVQSVRPDAPPGSRRLAYECGGSG